MDIFLRRVSEQRLEPATEYDQEKIAALKPMEVYRFKATKTRNWEKHKKFFGLLRFAFQYFDPTPIHGIKPDKEFESFREWVIIQCGYYTIVGYPDGSSGYKAKSIAWASMDEDQFRKLHSNAINVVLGYMGNLGFTYEQLLNLEQEVLGYE